jgi:hypothetical protein
LLKDLKVPDRVAFGLEPNPALAIAVGAALALREDTLSLVERYGLEVENGEPACAAPNSAATTAISS